VQACVQAAYTAYYQKGGRVEVARRVEDGYDRAYVERQLGDDQGWE
jgi:hypothetical protein